MLIQGFTHATWEVAGGIKKNQPKTVQERWTSVNSPTQHVNQLFTKNLLRPPRFQYCLYSWYLSETYHKWSINFLKCNSSVSRNYSVSSMRFYSSSVCLHSKVGKEMSSKLIRAKDASLCALQKYKYQLKEPHQCKCINHATMQINKIKGLFSLTFYCGAKDF